MKNLILFSFIFVFGASAVAKNKPDAKTVVKAAPGPIVPEGYIYSFLGNPKYWGLEPVKSKKEEKVEKSMVQMEQSLSDGESPIQETDDVPKLAPPDKVFDAIRVRVKSKTDQIYIAFAYCKDAIINYQNKNCVGMGKREDYSISDIIEKLRSIPNKPLKSMTSDERALIYGAKLMTGKFAKYLQTTMLEDLVSGNPKKYMLPFAKDMVAMNALINFLTSEIDASHTALLPGR
jgi:hypothetical protein